MATHYDCSFSEQTLDFGRMYHGMVPFPVTFCPVIQMSLLFEVQCSENL